MRFSVAVPTYKRPEALRPTLLSFLKNTRLPDEVLVIDDDTTSEELLAEMREAFAKQGVTFAYHKKDHSKIRRGLSESKNWAAQLATHDTICYLDDDVILEPGYFAELMKVWEEAGSDAALVGVGGRITNNRGTGRLEKLYRYLFGLSGRFAWDVNDVGFQVWDESVEETQKGYYLHGGVSSYRRGAILEMPFEVFSGGRTGLEDVEHCLRAKRAGKHFVYAAKARLAHYPAPAARERAYESGKKESVNRREIFRKHCVHDMRHQVWFAWASIGWIVKKVLTLNFRAAAGMIAGLYTR